MANPVTAEAARQQLDFSAKYTRSLGLLEDWAEQLSLLQNTVTPWQREMERSALRCRKITSKLPLLVNLGLF
jgi:hypothetical protein